jgi:putative membrane protein
MNIILKIFRKDVIGLCRNFLALVVAGGLCVIPSLYAWFNIYSNWDPYANTASIQIAIVSEDAGYEQAAGDKVCMGEKVVEQLHSNNKLGWHFPSTSEEALDDLYAGNYYAVIIVGEDFSRSLYDFLENGLNPPTITYYENSKKNAVASKITDSGRSTLQQTINTEFINVCVETIISNLNQMAEQDPDIFGKMLSDLAAVGENVESYNTMIDSFVASNNKLSENLLEMESLLPSIQTALDNSAATAGVANSTVNQVLDDTMNKLDITIDSMNSLVSDVLSSLESVGNLAVSNTPEAAASLDTAASQVSALMQQNDALSDVLSELSGVDGVDSSVIAVLQGNIAAINALEEITLQLISQSSNLITDMPTLIQAKYELLKPILVQCEQKLESVQNLYQTSVRQSVASLKASVEAATTTIADNLESAGGSLSGMSQLLLGLHDIVLGANSSLDSVQIILGQLQERLGAVSDRIGGVEDSEGYQLLSELMEADAATYAEFLSEPVKVEQIDVYPAVNYGTSVTPFYTTLAIWVGAIVLVALIKVYADYTTGAFAQATENQRYFGRMLLFLAMGQIQTVIIVLGDLYILKISCVHPFMFWFASAVASVIFTMFIYTLTLTFGDVGKAVAVVMVVIQIAGSGGTYPIELLPEFFKKVYLYFPFPYAINAMREAISGLYECDYAVYLAKLCVYAVISLVLGVVIRKPLLEVKEFFERRMKQTGFM